MSSLPRVTVIVLNFNGRQHLDHCLASLAGLDYPEESLDVLLVDNGSSDDSVDHVRAKFPSVEVLENHENLGYAAAINRGARSVDTPLLALLNNDARVDPAWLARLVARLDDADVAAVGSKVMAWDGETVHYAGGGCNVHGAAFQVGRGERDRAEFGEPGPTLFACGAAMVVRRDVFLDLDGFDEGYFAYYEDVDLGWRLWVAGHRVLYEPSSFVFHHQSATSVRIPLYRLRVLHIRNPIYTIFKNYESANLNWALPAALLLSLKRTWHVSRLKSHAYRIGPLDHHLPDADSRVDSSVGDLYEQQSVPKVALADLVAYNDLCENFEQLSRKRAAVQTMRRRSDAEIMGLFREPFHPAEDEAGYEALLENLKGFFDLASVVDARE